MQHRSVRMAQYPCDPLGVLSCGEQQRRCRVPGLVGTPTRYPQPIKGGVKHSVGKVLRVDWSPTWGRKNVVTRLLEAMFAAPQEHVPYRRQHRDVSDGVQALGVILGAACGECLSNFDNAP